MTAPQATLLAIALAGAPPIEDPGGLALTSCRLPDGRAWTLGPKGVGRPFMARLTLSNRGDAPIHLWDPKNTEGMACASILLTDAAGDSRRLKPVAAPRAGGVATFLKLDPKQTVTLELELLRLVGEDPLPPGKYVLTPIYENDLGSKPPKPDVWIGKLEGDPLDIEIVEP